MLNVEEIMVIVTIVVPYVLNVSYFLGKYANFKGKLLKFNVFYNANKFYVFMRNFCIFLMNYQPSTSIY